SQTGTASIRTSPPSPFTSTPRRAKLNLPRCCSAAEREKHNTAMRASTAAKCSTYSVRDLRTRKNAGIPRIVARLGEDPAQARPDQDGAGVEPPEARHDARLDPAPAVVVARDPRPHA